jgi:hypothetical protein
MSCYFWGNDVNDVKVFLTPRDLDKSDMSWLALTESAITAANPEVRARTISAPQLCMSEYECSRHLDPEPADQIYSGKTSYMN